jgi:hypothetical protein
MSLATQIPIQSGNSLAYNPSEFFDIRQTGWKNADSLDNIDNRLTALENMHKIGIGLLVVLGVLFIIYKK